jgi:hypothetical protein
VWHVAVRLHCRHCGQQDGAHQIRKVTSTRSLDAIIPGECIVGDRRKLEEYTDLYYFDAQPKEQTI